MERYCRHCKIPHPNNTEYWIITDRKGRPDKRYACRAHSKIVGAKYRNTNLEKSRAIVRQSMCKHRKTNEARFSKLCRQAHERNYPVELTLSDYISLTENNTCHYCDGELPKVGHGIDRLDNTIGYTLKNCVPCCSICNIAKASLGREEFRLWVIAVYSHWAGRN